MSESPRIVTLRDAATGSSAQILVNLGFNCFSFVAAFDEEELEVLWAEAEFELGRGRPSGSGIPLLFPFPGRIHQGRLTWGGRQYVLDANDGQGNAIHGFVHTRPWRVIEQRSNQVTGQFRASQDDPVLEKFWPADFQITATYQLDGQRLLGRFLLENTDSQPLPLGFGAHPYFRLPLGGEDAAECEIRLPVSGEWELSELITTGEYFPLRDAEVFQRGLRFGDMQFDNVFGGLVFDDDDWCRASIIDPSSQRRLSIAWDRVFRECVVYTPPHREAICIEPYTCAPDPTRLEAAGIDAGLRVLQPGESLTAQLELRVE
jgi:aldose 1-epimerase